MGRALAARPHRRRRAPAQRTRGADVSSEGASYAVTRGEFRTDVFVNSVCPEQAAGVYAWRLDGERLTLTEVDDACADRVDVFAGTWRRLP